MAGMEKVDEFSGDYPGWLMYGYKHNHIQISPKYRKQFRNARHVLVIKFGELRQVYKGGGTSSFDPTAQWFTAEYHHSKTPDTGKFWKGPGWYDYEKRKRYSKFEYLTKLRIISEYEYDLYCPDLQGQVEGHYMNYSFDLSAVKRRLKRMIKTRKLNIIFIDENEDLANSAERYFTEIYGS
jgi:hypothetical protein